MTTPERIKHLRKEILNMSREKFGAAIGVSADVINNIERDRLQNPEQKEPLYILISQKFGVNLSWIKCESDVMKPPASRDDEIADIVKAAAQHDPEKALEFFSEFFRGFSDGEIVLMYEIFRKHFPK